MKTIKKLSLILLITLGIFSNPKPVQASSGNLNISASSNTVIVGNTLTVTVTLSSGSPLGAWEFDVNYDTNFLKLTSSNAENNGTYFVNAGNGSLKSKTYTLKFRALKSGSTSITVGSYDIYAYDTSKMSITKSNKKINIMTQQELEASYSKDNFLKSLIVEGHELDKPFAKETLEYSVNVPTGTTSVKVIASENDSKSTVNGAGDIEVSEGLNSIPITVTAQNGDQKTYTLTVNVEDQNPINVKVNNENYVVVKTSSLITAPPTFEETKITINDCEISAFINNKAKITLVGLKDSEGKINLFTYDNGKYTPYQEMELKNYLLILLPFDQELDLIKTNVTINNQKIDAYKYSEKSEFVIINAKNLENGKTSLYLYDTINKTASRYDDTYLKETKETITNYTYIIIAFASILVILLIIIFSLLHSVKKKTTKIRKFIEKYDPNFKDDTTFDEEDNDESTNKPKKKTKSSKENSSIEDIEIKQEPKKNKIKIEEPKTEDLKQVLADVEEVYTKKSPKEEK